MKLRMFGSTVEQKKEKTLKEEVEMYLDATTWKTLMTLVGQINGRRKRMAEEGESIETITVTEIVTIFEKFPEGVFDRILHEGEHYIRMKHKKEIPGDFLRKPQNELAAATAHFRDLAFTNIHSDMNKEKEPN